MYSSADGWLDGRAILDRFLHHSEIITITGQSYRLRNRSEGSKPAKAPTGSDAEQEDGKSVND